MSTIASTPISSGSAARFCFSGEAPARLRPPRSTTSCRIGWHVTTLFRNKGGGAHLNSTIDLGIQVCAPFLKDVFQRELQNSGIKSSADLTELRVRSIRERGSGITRPERVQHVERFGSKLHALRFIDAKLPRQRYVKRPAWRTNQIVPAVIAERSQSGDAESRLVQPERKRAARSLVVRLGIREQLIRALVCRTAEVRELTIHQPVTAGADVDGGAGGSAVDSREPPARSQQAHLVSGKLRSLGQSSQIEEMPAIALTVPMIEGSVACFRMSFSRIRPRRLQVRCVTRAVGPGVIGLDAEALREPLLHSQEHAVVIEVRSAVEQRNRP